MPFRNMREKNNLTGSNACLEPAKKPRSLRSGDLGFELKYRCPGPVFLHAGHAGLDLIDFKLNLCYFCFVIHLLLITLRFFLSIQQEDCVKKTLIPLFLFVIYKEVLSHISLDFSNKKLI